MQRWFFRNSERTKLLGVSRSLPEGKSVHADSYGTTAPKPPTEATPLWQMLFKWRERVHFKCPFTDICKFLDIQNIWRGLANKEGRPGDPGPSSAAAWGLLQHPTESTVTPDITRQVKDLSPSPRVLHCRIFHWESWNRLADVGTAFGQL